MFNVQSQVKVDDLVFIKIIIANHPPFGKFQISKIQPYIQNKGPIMLGGFET